MTPADRLERLGEGMTPRPWAVGGNVITDSRDLIALRDAGTMRYVIARMGRGADADRDGLLALRNALPELVAVVRAAETYRMDLRIENSYALGDALAALDARLAETDSGDGLESPSGVEGER